MAGGLTNEEYQALIDQHGGIIGTRKIDPYIEEKIGDTVFQRPNDNPAYQVIFKDGTHMTVRAEGTYDEQSNTWDVQSWNVEDTGTAYGGGKHSSAANFENVTDPRTGEIIALHDPASGQRIDLPKLPQQGPPKPEPPKYLSPNTTAPYLLRQNPDGTTTREPNPNYSPPTSAQRSPTVLGSNTSAPFITMMQPDGTISTQPNPNYQPGAAQSEPWATTSTTAPYLLRQGPDGTLEQLGNPNYQDPWNTPSAAWQRAQQQATLASNMYGRTADLYASALPRLAAPGQEYAAGFEPGGIMSQIFGNMGMNYNPEQYRVTWIDPNALWQQAQQMAASWMQQNQPAQAEG